MTMPRPKKPAKTVWFTFDTRTGHLLDLKPTRKACKADANQLNEHYEKGEERYTVAGPYVLAERDAT